MVSESHGNMFFSPEKLVEELQAINAERISLDKELEKIAKKQVQYQVAVDAVLLKLREHFEEAGVPKVWLKEIGLNMDALLEGEYIVNLTEVRR